MFHKLYSLGKSSKLTNNNPMHLWIWEYLIICLFLSSDSFSALCNFVWINMFVVIILATRTSVSLAHTNYAFI